MRRLVRTDVATAYAWGGGVAFVLSLWYFVWAYVAGLDRPAGGPGDGAADLLAPIAFDVSLFTLFALHHSAMARPGAKDLIARIVPPPLERSTYVWIASGLFLATCWLWRPVPGVLYRHTGALAVPHALVQLVGGFMAVYAASRLDFLELAGIRQARLEVRPQRDLVTGWPYDTVRHPVYLGWLLLVFGAAEMTATRATFAVTSTAYLVLAVPWEERALVRAHGDTYTRYCRRVTWKIVPFLY